MNKDKISLYMFRNTIATLVVAFISFIFSLMNFYQCNVVEAMQRLLVYDIYTTLYFLLIWLFNYLIFEVSKIIYDIYEQKITFIPCLVLIVCTGIVFFIPIRDVFQYNLALLFILISIRMIKEMYKRSPELFQWMKKRPKTGLK